MPILAKTYQGIQGGMNQAVPQHEIPDGQASYMQDIILNLPGIIKRRGPIQKISGSATVPTVATGIIAVQDMLGVFKVAVLGGTNAVANLSFYNTALSSVTGPYSLTAGSAGVPAIPSIVDAKSALGNGAIIGAANTYVPLISSNTFAEIIYWRGAALAADITTANCTCARGSTAVTTGTAGGFNNVTQGMFVYNGNIYIGVVQSVQTGTALTLETGAGIPLAATALTFKPTRPLSLKVMKGRIGIAPGSLIVNGTQGPEGTKFKSQGLDGGAPASWALYRLSDNAYIGVVGVVTDNATLTLISNNLPATAPGLTNERYYAIRVDSSINPPTYSVTNNQYLIPVVGFLNSVWNGRQWYANIPMIKGGDNFSARVWFSDPADFEGVDLSTDDGDFIDVGSTSGPQSPIVGLQGIPNGLLVFKESETFIITGSDYTNLTVRKLADIGALGIGSIQAQGNGAIWAGREGIFYSDGTSIRPLSSQLGDFWTQGIANFNLASNRMASYIWKNQYVLYVQNFSGFTQHRAGASSGTATTTFCINLDTFAITTFSNAVIKDSTNMPSTSGFPTLALVDDAGTPGTASIVDTAVIHSAIGTGSDAINTMGFGSVGPDFYLETKKYDLGDPERKKLFKQLAMNYLLAGNTLAMDTVPGLNTVGTAINTTWATQAAWTNLRKKFTKRDTHLQFRFYQSSSAVTDVQIGPLAIGFKLQRVGRV